MDTETENQEPKTENRKALLLTECPPEEILIDSSDERA
jgi:hypothetical protein